MNGKLDCSDQQYGPAGCAHHFMFHLTPEMHKLKQEADAPLGLTFSTRLLAMHVRLGDVYTRLDHRWDMVCVELATGWCDNSNQW